VESFEWLQLLRGVPWKALIDWKPYLKWQIAIHFGGPRKDTSDLQFKATMNRMASHCVHPSIDPDAIRPICNKKWSHVLGIATAEWPATVAPSALWRSDLQGQGGASLYSLKLLWRGVAWHRFDFDVCFASRLAAIPKNMNEEHLSPYLLSFATPNRRS
jgi:hypothetical protein